MAPSFIEEGTALVTRYQEHGYLYLPALLESEKVFDLREAYFTLFDSIIFKKNTSPRQGIFSGEFQYATNEHGHPHHPASAFVQSPVFDHFTRDQRLYALASLLVGGEVVQLQRRPFRHFYNKTCQASRAHIDYTYLDQGTAKLVTIWIPIGDIALDGGGLVYLKNSHKLNLEWLRENTEQQRDRPNDKRPISHDLKMISEITGMPWLWSEFKAGDVLVHSPFIVHASLDLYSDVMRLSTDLRFSSAREISDSRWSGDWKGNDGL